LRAQILNLFQKSDSRAVLKNIKMFAQMLQVQVDEIPKFLADYGDLYMSTSLLSVVSGKYQPDFR